MLRSTGRRIRANSSRVARNCSRRGADFGARPQAQPRDGSTRCPSAIFRRAPRRPTLRGGERQLKPKRSKPPSRRTRFRPASGHSRAGRWTPTNRTRTQVGTRCPRAHSCTPYPKRLVVHVAGLGDAPTRCGICARLLVRYGAELHMSQSLELMPDVCAWYIVDGELQGSAMLTRVE